MEDILEIVNFWFEDKDVTATEIKANVTKIHCNNKSYILKEKGSINEKSYINRFWWFREVYISKAVRQ
ncbi:hypothetical protein BC30090_2591 [Bacillus cereus]|nr:hypothetical protein BC30090_2591 [Bacillus cereus]